VLDPKPPRSAERERRGMASSQQLRSSPRLSDEELEYYGDLYVRCAIRDAGVEFESFLDNPEYYLQKYARGHPALSGRDGDGERKGFLRYLRFRHETRTPSE
jgi:hypothetical protein